VALDACAGQGPPVVMNQKRRFCVEIRRIIEAAIALRHTVRHSWVEFRIEARERGADSNLFRQGAAKESHDPDVIVATLAKPGVVLRRPVGTDRPFSEHAELPPDLGPRQTKPQVETPKGEKAFLSPRRQRC
jgi:hypothetical protein